MYINAATLCRVIRYLSFISIIQQLITIKPNAFYQMIPYSMLILANLNKIGNESILQTKQIQVNLNARALVRTAGERNVDVL